MNTSLTALAREQLELALAASSGRSAHTVFGGSEHHLRQTVIALASGRMLDEHSNPGDATVTSSTDASTFIGRRQLGRAAGHLIAVPDAAHSLAALEDSVILLTVVGRA